MRRPSLAEPCSADQEAPIVSDDGAINFVVTATEAGACVERIEPLTGIGRLSHLMVFKDMSAFDRSYEADPLRHVYPLVYWKLRQTVGRLLER
jgi:hypothetical protein